MENTIHKTEENLMQGERKRKEIATLSCGQNSKIVRQIVKRK